VTTARQGSPPGLDSTAMTDPIGRPAVEAESAHNRHTFPINSPCPFHCRTPSRLRRARPPEAAPASTDQGLFPIGDQVLAVSFHSRRYIEADRAVRSSFRELVSCPSMARRAAIHGSPTVQIDDRSGRMPQVVLLHRKRRSFDVKQRTRSVINWRQSLSAVTSSITTSARLPPRSWP
jgi:hypothetical protein